MDQPTSIFDRVFGRPRPVWVVLSVSLSLLLLPIVFVYLDGALNEFFNQGRWRIFLLPPTIILYIWIISPHMTRMGTIVIESIRPLVQLDDENFDHQISEVSRINPLHEWVAFGIGVALAVELRIERHHLSPRRRSRRGKRRQLFRCGVLGQSGLLRDHGHRPDEGSGF